MVSKRCQDINQKDRSTSFKSPYYSAGVTSTKTSSIVPLNSGVQDSLFWWDVAVDIWALVTVAEIFLIYTILIPLHFLRVFWESAPLCYNKLKPNCFLRNGARTYYRVINLWSVGCSFGLLPKTRGAGVMPPKSPWLTQNFAQWRQDRTWLTQVFRSHWLKWQQCFQVKVVRSIDRNTTVNDFMATSPHILIAYYYTDCVDWMV